MYWGLRSTSYVYITKKPTLARQCRMIRSAVFLLFISD